MYLDAFWLCLNGMSAPQKCQRNTFPVFFPCMFYMNTEKSTKNKKMFSRNRNMHLCKYEYAQICKCIEYPLFFK